MKLYLIRHGESNLNRLGIHQDGSAELSANGLKQAEQVAKRFSNITIDIVLTSTYTRARQTAEAIAKKLHKNPDLDAQLVEFRRPTIIVGRKTDDPEVVNIKNKIFANWDNPRFRYSDEETFFEFKDRIELVLKKIENIKKDHVLVVTHGHVITMLLCLMAFENSFPSVIFDRFRKFLKTSNTGVTVCNYEDNKWKLITCNDTSHLPK